MIKYLFCIFFVLTYFSCIAQNIATYAGIGISGYSGDGSPATSARIYIPGNGVFDNDGNFYFPQRIGHRIRKISSLGIISTIAGTGMAGFGGDGGNATSAMIDNPVDVELDYSGNLYIVDLGNNRIRKVNLSTNTISTFGGNGISGFSGDGGYATSASFSAPHGICIDKNNNVYVIDYNNQRVRKINASGIISTVAGNGNYGFTSDGGLADTTTLNYPLDIAVDTADDLFIADCGNYRIRKVEISTGLISTVAGNGSGLYNGEGILGVSAGIHPYGIVFDMFNNLYISDNSNNRARKIDIIGNIHTVAGTGISGYGGDGGNATNALLNRPEGVSIDQCGNLYIGDAQNNRIRKVTFNPKTTPTLSITGFTNATVGSPVTVSAAVSGAGSSYSIRWLNRGVEFATTTVPVVSYTKALGTDTITARVVPVVSYCYDSATSAAHIVNTSTAGMWGGSGIAASIYPNPANNTLTVAAPGLSGISITNLLGQVVLAMACGSDEVHLDIAGLPARVYVVRVTDANGAVAVRRVVKE